MTTTTLTSAPADTSTSAPTGTPSTPSTPASPAALGERTARVCGGRLNLRVRTLGTGPDLLYFHSVNGFFEDPFIARLSEHFTVHAPEFPGTTPSDPYAIHQLDNLWEVVLAYEEALRTLGLLGMPAIGHGFGGMLAAELAAAYPQAFSKLVLIAPLGLWSESAPVANWMTTPAAQLPQLLFADPQGAAAQAAAILPENPDAALRAAVSQVWATGCTGKFTWPIPDRGLSRRLHRVSAPTLLLWGAQDRLNPAFYATEFARLIAGSTVEVLPDSGHLPQLEQPAASWRAINDFLSAGEEHS